MIPIRIMEALFMLPAFRCSQTKLFKLVVQDADSGDDDS